MQIQELKDKCNTLYKNTIELFGKYGDYRLISKNLLDIASMLLDIGKKDVLKTKECEQKALKLLTISKELNASKNIYKAYFALTNQVLPQEQKVEKPTVIGKEPIKDSVIEVKKPKDDLDPKFIKEILANKKQTSYQDEVVPSNFQYNWDNLPSTTFDDVAGLDDVKNEVMKKVLLPLKNPELYEGYVKKNGGGLLLYGPPGTGKTMIAAAIAREIGAKFCSIGASDLVLNGIGSSTKAIVNLFKEARSFKCSVIFFDEIESLCSVSTHAQHTKEIRSELLRQIQGMEAYEKENDKIMLLIAATNKPWEIDPAFVRPGRFGTRIYVDLPDDKAREYMIKNRLAKIEKSGKVTIETIDYNKIVSLTNGFNGADMGNLLDEVQDISIMRSAKTNNKIILNDDFIQALGNIKTSVQKEDIKKLTEWKNLNG